MTMRSQQGLVDMPPQPRNMDRTPTAETQSGSNSGEGDLRRRALTLRRPVRVRTRHQLDWHLVKRIGGDASTVQKKNESIVINNDIVVMVVEIRGDKVRLGIVAPKEVPVHRQEVYDAIHGKPDAEPAPPTVVAKSSLESNTH